MERVPIQLIKINLFMFMQGREVTNFILMEQLQEEFLATKMPLH